MCMRVGFHSAFLARRGWEISIHNLYSSYTWIKSKEWLSGLVQVWSGPNLNYWALCLNSSATSDSWQWVLTEELLCRLLGSWQTLKQWCSWDGRNFTPIPHLKHRGSWYAGLSGLSIDNYLIVGPNCNSMRLVQNPGLLAQLHTLLLKVPGHQDPGIGEPLPHPDVPVP